MLSRTQDTSEQLFFFTPLSTDPDAERKENTVHWRRRKAPRPQSSLRFPLSHLTIRTSRFTHRWKGAHPATVDDLIDPHEQDASPKERKRGLWQVTLVYYWQYTSFAKDPLQWPYSSPKKAWQPLAMTGTPILMIDPFAGMCQRMRVWEW